MEQLASYKLDRWFFEDFHFVGDLIEYDGPVVVHYRHNDRHAIYYWVDNNEKLNRWLCFEITIYQLYDYLNRDASLRDLVIKCSSQPFFTVDVDSDLRFSNFQLLNWIAIPEKYIPEINSYFTLKVPSRYNEEFEKLNKDDFTQAVRQRSYDLIIKPRNRRNKDLLTIEKIGGFLSYVDRSYDSFSAYYFIEKYKEKIPNIETLLKTTKQFVKSSKPLAADNWHGSFGVSLTTELADSANMLPEYVQLRAEILREFKVQVLDIDLGNEETVNEVISKFEETYRKKIFDPLIKIINDTEYSLTVINKRENSIKNFEKVRPYNVKKIVPKKEPLDENITDAKKVFLTITLEVEENKDFKNLSRKDFAEATLFSTIGNAVSHDFDSLENDKYLVQLARPISLIFERSDNLLKISFEPLNISVSHADKDVAYILFNDKFFELFESDYLAQKPKNKANWEYLSSVVTDYREKE